MSIKKGNRRKRPYRLDRDGMHKVVYLFNMSRRMKQNLTKPYRIISRYSIEDCLYAPGVLG